ncbi:MAG: hypothetical protein JRF33_05670 [Deltaproteobacteria bacterium]|nr:hypothetical protein [Deltaproteobacteria bacterium]
MISIASYLHRNELRDLIWRWVYNRPEAADADRITRLVLFNNIYVARYLDLFANRIFSGLHDAPLRRQKVRVKKNIKDSIVANPPYTNLRIERLLEQYRNHPERYYRETPFHGTLFFEPIGGEDFYVGASRIKRVRRLAEKISRRIIDRIFFTIKSQAERLADARAKTLGIPRDQLVTAPQDMISEFHRAEQRMLEDLKHNRDFPAGDDIVIQDVAGIKVILENAEQKRLTDMLQEAPDTEIIEVEPHTGAYNATNIIVRHKPPVDEILAQPLGPEMLSRMWRRGMLPDQAQESFADFVRSGESSVHIEIIVSNYQEMLESEIGRCMHEDRIIEQRLRQEYRGHLAKNVEYLTEYLFAFAVSPRTECTDLPIKLWNRYLPDYYDEVIKSLFNIPPIYMGD